MGGRDTSRDASRNGQEPILYYLAASIFPYGIKGTAVPPLTGKAAKIPPATGVYRLSHTRSSAFSPVCAEASVCPPSPRITAASPERGSASNVLM